MCECDFGVLLWSLLSGYSGPAWGALRLHKEAFSLRNVPSQIEEEPDQSITTLRGSQRLSLDASDIA